MGKKIEPVKREIRLADAVSEAFSTYEDLGSQMRDWADNLEERLSHTQKYEDVSSAADTLEGLSAPEVPSAVADIPVTFHDLPARKRGYSRADQCSQAGAILDACIEALTAFIERTPESDPVGDEALGLVEALDDAKDEADGVEFPGMYG